MEQREDMSTQTDTSLSLESTSDIREKIPTEMRYSTPPASVGSNLNMPSYPDTPIYALYGKLRNYQTEPRLYYRFNERIGNIEYLIADDLAPWLPAGSQLEARARQFLRDEAQLFGLDARWVDQTVFLKHRLHSLMGNHYIFGLRSISNANFGETLNTSLVFHFDLAEQLVMVTGTYYPLVDGKRFNMDSTAYQASLRPNGLAIGAVPAQGPVGITGAVAVEEALLQPSAVEGTSKLLWDNAKVEATLRAIAQDRYRVTAKGKAEENLNPQPQQVALFQPERKTIFNRSQQRHEACIQVKYVTAQHDAVFIINGQGSIVECFHVDARAPIHIAYTYRQFWQSEEPTTSPTDQLQPLNLPNLHKVVLRDLTSDTDLIGRYVDVRDVAGFTKPIVWGDLLENPALSFDAKSSLADRILAYYHIDQIQRYFRELGLTILDQYPSLNPIRVELGAQETKFQPNVQRILFKHLMENSIFVCTEARSSHIVYHEFVHAVTDALARLRRDSDSSEEKEKAWRIQVRQAHGLDEGYADYFACSLATRQGATFTTINSLQVDNQGKITVISHGRDLGKIGSNIEGGDAPSMERMIEVLKTHAEEEVQWPEEHLLGRSWAAFLWLCREQMTPDIADIVIAHSIFFLTRWSTFGAGVMALVLADRLLFDGIHEQMILDKAGGQMAKDWTTPQEFTSSRDVLR